MCIKDAKPVFSFSILAMYVPILLLVDNLAARLHRILQTKRHERSHSYPHSRHRKLPRSIRCLENLSSGAAIANRRLLAASFAPGVGIARSSAARRAPLGIKFIRHDARRAVRRPSPRD